MLNKFKYLILVLLIVPLLNSCKEDFEPYDHPFIHIMKDDVSLTTVNAGARVLGEYKVFLSSKALDKTLTVTYSITPGDGLKEGVDYELVTQGTTLDFLPGIYDMPIRVRWLPHTIDETKQNTLTIRLESNSMNLTMGLPGKSEFQREFIIYKN